MYLLPWHSLSKTGSHLSTSIRWYSIGQPLSLAMMISDVTSCPEKHRRVKTIPEEARAKRHATRPVPTRSFLHDRGACPCEEFGCPSFYFPFFEGHARDTLSSCSLSKLRPSQAERKARDSSLRCSQFEDLDFFTSPRQCGTGLPVLL